MASLLSQSQTPEGASGLKFRFILLKEIHCLLQHLVLVHRLYQQGFIHTDIFHLYDQGGHRH